MPRCEGLPDQDCSINKNDNTVMFSQGDIWLCPKCKNIRFPSTGATMPEDTDQTLRKQGIEENSDPMRNHISVDSTPTDVLLEPLLAYTVFSLQSATCEHVRRAVLGHFTNEQIVAAKDALWTKCDHQIIGDKPRRRDSLSRPEKEAHLQDILTALGKLDKAAKVPAVAILAEDLHLIPRSHPEELNDISLADRLNRLEHKISCLSEVVDRTMSENIVIKERLDQRESLTQGSSTNLVPAYSVPAYSDVVSGRPPRNAGNTVQQSKHDDEQATATAVQWSEPGDSSATNTGNDQTSSLPTHWVNSNMTHSDNHSSNPHRGRGLGQGFGRGFG